MLNGWGSNWLLLGGIFTASVGILAIKAALRPRSHDEHHAERTESIGKTADKLTVLSGTALLQHTSFSALVDECRKRMQIDRALFDKNYYPVIEHAASWVQMLPASESHHHAHPGGLIQHMLETVLHASRFREGVMLPVGASVEEIPARKHRWTYGVFLAALLHDIGRPVADLKVRIWRGSSKKPEIWHPLAGSMLDQGARWYTLAFDVDTRNYDLHKKLPIILFQRIVPPEVLSWIAEDAQLIHELTAYLSGDDTYTGALRGIVTRADSESVRTNLLHGPRTRFASAKTVPLIERLMQALRMMLDEGKISLNRPGAAAFVFDGSVWFVSKRLADDVRAFLIERESKDGIPGPDKNDRLFDTWQEYGALIPTPDHRAVWHAEIALDSWVQTFTLLRFPLEKLYRSADRYPQNMNGSIRIVQPEREPPVPAASSQSNAPDQPVSPPAPISTKEENTSDAADGDNPFADAVVSDDSRHKMLAQPIRNESPMDVQSQPGVAPTRTIAPVESQQTEPKQQSAALPAISAKKLPGVIASVSQKTPGAVASEEFLHEDDAAVPIAKRADIDAGVLKPVAPRGELVPKPPLSARKNAKTSEAALRFMRWLQEGLANGDLPYNRSDAMIHFVPEGMMLVSPAIFREFASKFGEDGTGTPSDRVGSAFGTGIQRQVTNAGWNLQVGEKKSNIIRYVVVGPGNNATEPEKKPAPGSRALIAGVVISSPERFVNPLPERNPCLVRFDRPLE